MLLLLLTGPAVHRQEGSQIQGRNRECLYGRGRGAKGEPVEQGGVGI